MVIEHNLDVIKTADHILDLGPGGGVRGGEIVAQGIPEEVPRNPRSYTGQYLKAMLKAYPWNEPAPDLVRGRRKSRRRQRAIRGGI